MSFSDLERPDAYGPVSGILQTRTVWPTAIKFRMNPRGEWHICKGSAMPTFPKGQGPSLPRFLRVPLYLCLHHSYRTTNFGILTDMGHGWAFMGSATPLSILQMYAVCQQQLSFLFFLVEWYFIKANSGSGKCTLWRFGVAVMRWS